MSADIYLPIKFEEQTLIDLVVFYLQQKETCTPFQFMVKLELAFEDYELCEQLADYFTGELKNEFKEK